MSKITKKEYQELRELLHQKDMLKSLINGFSSEYVPSTMLLGKKYQSSSSIEIGDKEDVSFLFRNLPNITDKINAFTLLLLEEELGLVEEKIALYMKEDK